MTTFFAQNELIKTPYFDSISLKFTQSQWVVDVAGYKVSALQLNFQFLTFNNIKNYPQNSRKKSVKLPQVPEKSEHIIDCKTYDKCKVTEKFVTTSESLIFTRKQEMLDISRKKMLQEGCICLGLDSMVNLFCTARKNVFG